ncbi:MAG: hypothetical protein AAF713_11675 [Pseudomonadota bacterium]
MLSAMMMNPLYDMPEASLELLVSDLAALVHLLAVTVAFGTVIFTDYSTLKRVRHPIDGDWLDSLERAHTVISAGMIMLWVSGIVLVGMRTGFQADNFSAKLIGKLIIVSMLAGTAMAIKFLVFPILVRARGRALFALSLPEKRQLATCGGLSVAGWSLALLFGGSTILKTAGPSTVAFITLTAYASALLACHSVATLTHQKSYSRQIDVSGVAAE